MSEILKSLGDNVVFFLPVNCSCTKEKYLQELFFYNTIECLGIWWVPQLEIRTQTHTLYARNAVWIRVAANSLLEVRNFDMLMEGSSVTFAPFESVAFC